jgi:hypothetical protein
MKDEANRAYSTEIIETAQARFLFMWEMCSGKVTALKRMSILTFLVTILAITWQISASLTELSCAKVTGIGAIAGGLAESFVQLTLGLFACTMIYATYSFYEGMLARRRISWNLFAA